MVVRRPERGSSHGACLSTASAARDSPQAPSEAVSDADAQMQTGGKRDAAPRRARPRPLGRSAPRKGRGSSRERARVAGRRTRGRGAGARRPKTLRVHSPPPPPASCGRARGTQTTRKVWRDAERCARIATPRRREPARLRGGEASGRERGGSDGEAGSGAPAGAARRRPRRGGARGARSRRDCDAKTPRTTCGAERRRSGASAPRGHSEPTPRTDPARPPAGRARRPRGGRPRDPFGGASLPRAGGPSANPDRLSNRDRALRATSRPRGGQPALRAEALPGPAERRRRFVRPFDLLPLPTRRPSPVASGRDAAAFARTGGCQVPAQRSLQRQERAREEAEKGSSGGESRKVEGDEGGDWRKAVRQKANAEEGRGRSELGENAGRAGSLGKWSGGRAGARRGRSRSGRRGSRQRRRKKRGGGGLSNAGRKTAQPRGRARGNIRTLRCAHRSRARGRGGGESRRGTAKPAERNEAWAGGAVAAYVEGRTRRGQKDGRHRECKGGNRRRGWRAGRYGPSAFAQRHGNAAAQRGGSERRSAKDGQRGREDRAPRTRKRTGPTARDEPRIGGCVAVAHGWWGNGGSSRDRSARAKQGGELGELNDGDGGVKERRRIRKELVWSRARRRERWKRLGGRADGDSACTSNVEQGDARAPFGDPRASDQSGFVKKQARSPKESMHAQTAPGAAARRRGSATPKERHRCRQGQKLDAKGAASMPAGPEVRHRASGLRARPRTSDRDRAAGGVGRKQARARRRPVTSAEARSTQGSFGRAEQMDAPRSGAKKRVLRQPCRAGVEERNGASYGSSSCAQKERFVRGAVACSTCSAALASKARQKRREEGRTDAAARAARGAETSSELHSESSAEGGRGRNAKEWEQRAAAGPARRQGEKRGGRRREVVRQQAQQARGEGKKREGRGRGGKDI